MRPTVETATVITTAGPITLELYTSYSPVAIRRIIEEFAALCAPAVAGAASPAGPTAASPLAVSFVDSSAVAFSSTDPARPVVQWPDAPAEAVGELALPEPGPAAPPPFHQGPRSLFFSGPGIVAVAGAGATLQARLLITTGASPPSGSAVRGSTAGPPDPFAAGAGPDESTIVGRVARGMAVLRSIAAASVDDSGRPLTAAGVTSLAYDGGRAPLAPRPVGARHAGVDVSGGAAPLTAIGVVRASAAAKRTKGTSTVLAAIAADY